MNLLWSWSKLLIESGEAQLVNSLVYAGRKSKQTPAATSLLSLWEAQKAKKLNNFGGCEQGACKAHEGEQ